MDKPEGIGEAEKWERLMASIRKAAHILNKDLDATGWPDYLNWKVASDMNEKLWAQVYAKRRKKMDNPGIEKSESHKAARLELIKLKTDIEKVAPELESIYREAIEAAIGQAEQCNIRDAFRSYSFARDTSDLIGRRILTDSDVSTRVFRQRVEVIQDLAIEAMVEELTMYCNCDFQKRD